MIRATLVALAAAVMGCTGPALADPTVAVPPPAAPAQAESPPPVQPPNMAPSIAPSTPQGMPPGAEESGRYTFHAVNEGFVRLDSRTGQLSQCYRRDGIWSCTVAPDEREALESEIARLRQENVAMKKTLLAKGGNLPAGIAPAPQAGPVPPADVPDATPRPPKPPADADIDGVIAYMKNVWRKLVDMMLDLQRDVQRKI
jgi:hypothetical protein